MTQTGVWEKLRPPTQGALPAQARLEKGLELQESGEWWALPELVSGMSRAPGKKEICRALHRAALYQWMETSRWGYSFCCLVWRHRGTCWRTQRWVASRGSLQQHQQMPTSPPHLLSLVTFSLSLSLSLFFFFLAPSALYDFHLGFRESFERRERGWGLLHYIL